MSIIAFIGLGNMGSGMAANLAKAGHDVRAFDLDAAALARAVESGCSASSSAAEAVKPADVIITMLPAGKHVRAVYAADVIPNARKNALAVDCSTIDVESARAVASQAKAAGLRAADAPVSGGVAAAQAGTLAFMVGCENGHFEAIDSLLQPMARAIIHAGGSGAGQAAKICNNMLLGISMLGVCEAFALAEKLELDAARFFEIAKNASGQCWSLTSYCPWPGLLPTAPANRDYAAGFAAAMMLKDLALAQDAAQASGADTPIGAKARELYQAFVDEGFGDKDFSAILPKLRGLL